MIGDRGVSNGEIGISGGDIYIYGSELLFGGSPLCTMTLWYLYQGGKLIR